MGRVYDVRPDLSKGERGAAGGYRLEALGFSTWEPVKYACRVEFDDDADEGPALVTVIKSNDKGPVSVGGNLVYDRFRCHARITPKTLPLETPEPPSR